jgi:hypothetical protein
VTFGAEITEEDEGTQEKNTGKGKKKGTAKRANKK